jgi:hypothetical protein
MHATLARLLKTTPGVSRRSFSNQSPKLIARNSDVLLELSKVFGQSYSDHAQ